MKRITSLLIILALAMSFLGVSASTRRQIEVDANLINVTVNGEEINADNFLYGGTTYVPIRAVAEALGAEIEYVKDVHAANITLASDELLPSIVKSFRFLHEAYALNEDIYKQMGFIVNNFMTPGNTPVRATNQMDKSFELINETYQELEACYSEIPTDYRKELLNSLKELIDAYEACKYQCTLYLKSLINDNSSAEYVVGVRDAVYYWNDIGVDQYYDIKHSVDDNLYLMYSIFLGEHGQK